jgi:lipoprotein-anchoring transpeptidase ErfK/SrfK
MPERIRKQPPIHACGRRSIGRRAVERAQPILLLAVAISTLGIAPPNATAVSGQDLPSASIGTLIRGQIGWAKVPVFQQRNDLTAAFLLGGPDGPPPVVLMTEPAVDGWAHVLLPTRAQEGAPGPATGWIPTNGLHLVKADRRIEVQRSRHRVVVTDKGRVVRRMSAAVGQSATPTPAVATFVVAINKPIETQRSTDPLGPFTLHLAAWSTALPNYAVDGSWDGLIIQGTNCPKTCLGRSITNGSIRVSNDDVTWLARNLPVGTPVIIS